ncbi:MAG: YlzJ-like family protein [Bacillota bacterium]
MIIHSIIPPEVIFQGFPGNIDTKCYEAEFRGEKVMVEQLQDNQFRIARLLETCPHKFLDPAFMPGTIVDKSELKLVVEKRATSARNPLTP